MLNHCFVLLLILLLNSPLLAKTAPLSTSNALKLLHKFGYLSTEDKTNVHDPISDRRIDGLSNSDPDSLSLYPSILSNSVRAFQKYFSLPITGKLDDSTIKLLTSPRCGNPDTNANRQPNIIPVSKDSRLTRRKRNSVRDTRLRWGKKIITWQIQSYPRNHLNRSRTHAVFQHAFNKWSRVANLDFVEERDYTKPADICIKFSSARHEDSIAFDGPGGVLAHAFYPIPEPVYTLSGDAHFDNDEIWTDGPHQEFRNLVTVATHELGHSMGLGHSSVTTSVMFPYYLSKWSRVELDQDDINEMQNLYGPPKFGKTLPPEPDLPDIPQPPIVTTPSPDTKTMFDYCNISIDAIMEIRGLELYVFKGKMQWRVTWSKTISTWVSYQFRDGPANIRYYWNILPDYVDNVDAAIERDDFLIYIFRGNRFWLLLDNKHMAPGCPIDGLPLTELGLPSKLEKVDAIFKWAENNQFYLLAGEDYWLLNATTKPFGRIPDNFEYPRKIKLTWRGIPTPITTAFTLINGQTLFFRGSDYYSFDNNAMRVRPGFPKPGRLGILGCADP